MKYLDIKLDKEAASWPRSTQMVIVDWFPQLTMDEIAANAVHRVWDMEGPEPFPNPNFISVTVDIAPVWSGVIEKIRDMGFRIVKLRARYPEGTADPMSYAIEEELTA